MESRKKIGLVAFGFGEPASLIPNRGIAVRVAVLHHAGKADMVFTDRDVAPHLVRYQIPFQQIDPTRMPTTYRLAVFAVKAAKEQGMEELHVIAAPCHMWRCLRDLRWAAEENGVVLTLTPRSLLGGQYDPRAETKFTRSAFQWWPFETAYRIASTVFPNWYKRTRA